MYDPNLIQFSNIYKVWYQILIKMRQLFQYFFKLLKKVDVAEKLKSIPLVNLVESNFIKLISYLKQRNLNAISF